jgi:thioredoxin reductase (NADPH)
MDANIYDLIIIGAGPAGLAASIYASRYKTEHIIIAKEPGGQATEAHNIENWPGTISISGIELTQKMREHCEKLGGKIVMDSVMGIVRDRDVWKITTHTDNYKTKFIILALGMEYRKLQIPGETEFRGKGVSYCPTCDAPFFKEKIVAVVGGGNSAASAAMLLAQYASKVYMIYRGDQVKCDPAYCENFEKDPKITIIYSTNVKEIQGKTKVEKIILDKEYESKKELEVDGVFIEVGSEPGVELTKQLGVAIDEQGFIIVNSDQSTSVPGVYAAGDATTGSNKTRQIITAAAEGAVAAGSVHKKLQTTNQ